VVITQLVFFLAYVTSILSKHAVMADSSICDLSCICKIIAAARSNLVLANKEFLSDVASHSTINLGQNFQLVLADLITFVRHHLCHTQRLSTGYNCCFVQFLRARSEVASDCMTCLMNSRIESLLL